jgi:VanZ family protein
MFFLLTALFCFPFLKVSDQPLPIFATIAGGVILYGVIMEFIQKHFASARSFDLVDIVFDTIGSLAGLVAMQLFIQKNRPR